MTLPRAQGRQTRMIITEYELPRLEMATHDVHGNGDGKIWYSTHRSSFVGLLDPKTGAVKEYHVPLPTRKRCRHALDSCRQEGNRLGLGNWAHNIWRFDPKTSSSAKCTGSARADQRADGRQLRTRR
jgi:streptogramin lyase